MIFKQKKLSYWNLDFQIYNLNVQKAVNDLILFIRIGLFWSTSVNFLKTMKIHYWENKKMALKAKANNYTLSAKVKYRLLAGYWPASYAGNTANVPPMIEMAAMVDMQNPAR